MTSPSSLPIVLGWKPHGNPIRLDKLPPLEGECALHIHEKEGHDKGHLKLSYGDTPYCLSLFIFNLEAFLANRKVKARSYDLWDRKIMYAARLPSGELHPRNPGWIYREDAVLIDWGTYKLEQAKLEVVLERIGRRLRYLVVFTRIKKYYSPKYGFSVRSEYLLKPLEGTLHF